MNYSPAGSSVHGILQARILEWVTISSSRGSSLPRIEPGSPILQADYLPSDPPGKQRRLSAKELMLSDCGAREAQQVQQTLESLLDYREIKPINPKRINPEYSLEGLMLKFQYFGHLI